LANDNLTRTGERDDGHQEQYEEEARPLLQRERQLRQEEITTEIVELAARSRDIAIKLGRPLAISQCGDAVAIK